MFYGKNFTTLKTVSLAHIVFLLHCWWWTRVFFIGDAERGSKWRPFASAVRIRLAVRQLFPLKLLITPPLPASSPENFHCIWAIDVLRGLAIFYYRIYVCWSIYCIASNGVDGYIWCSSAEIYRLVHISWSFKCTEKKYLKLFYMAFLWE